MIGARGTGSSYGGGVNGNVDEVAFWTTELSPTTVSSIYTMRLTRIAATSDEYSGEVYVKFIDCHYQVDDRGSQEENTK